MKYKTELIVALDVDSLREAEGFVDMLCPVVKFFKIGSQLFTATGPEAVRMVGRKKAQVFLDLKFHDIPNTVSKAVGMAVAMDGIAMLTLHTQGGKNMLEEEKYAK